MRRWFRSFVIAALVLTPARAHSGTVLATRADLMTILGSGALTDDFESYPCVAGSVYNTGVSYMDHLSVLNGAGPGLVGAGATYSTIRAPFTWLGNGYLGIPTRSLVAWNYGVVSPAPPPSPEQVQLFFAILIDYAVPSRAVGFDMTRLGDVGIVTVELYDPLGNLIDDPVVIIPTVGGMVFFGYEDAGGIGTVVVKNTKFPGVWSPVIDNHTYGPGESTPTRASSWGRLKALYHR